MVCEYCGEPIQESQLHGHMRQHEDEGLVRKHASKGVIWWDATVAGKIARESRKREQYLSHYRTQFE